MLQLLRRTGKYHYEVIFSTDNFSEIKEKIREEISANVAPEQLMIANEGNILCKILGDEVI